MLGLNIFDGGTKYINWPNFNIYLKKLKKINIKLKKINIKTSKKKAIIVLSFIIIYNIFLL